MKFLYPKILIFLCLVFVLSCVKNEPDIPHQPITLGIFTECNFVPAHDTTYIHNHLIGKWKWYYIRCFWFPEKANGSEFKGLYLEFKADNTLVVSQNGVVTQTSSWKIEDLHAGYYGIDTQPLMYLTPGIIAFCENELAFLDSYVDGCDNYFVR
ncbi:MAG: hypothetical protein IPN29_06690 [Saprospiraceae bacterium]|nr:hypothetical protein [Saprospiraceae bacterium]